jgi:hypothetical protein
MVKAKDEANLPAFYPRNGGLHHWCRCFRTGDDV